MGYSAVVDYNLIKQDIESAVPKYAAKSGAEIHVPIPANIQGGNYVISSNTTLSNNLVVAGNLTIDSGITLTTNGYSIICSGTLTNNGTINAGLNSLDAAYPNSYGGSGGYSDNSNGGNGAYTLAPGGNSSSPNGSTPAAPSSLSNSTIQSWFNDGIQNYLTGAICGTASSSSGGGHGSYGIFIQANEIIAGTINANGENGDTNYGGGGGGVILLAYGSGGYTAGTYNVSGGLAGGSGSGNGGNGQVITYDYGTTPPLSIQTTNSITPISTGRIVLIAQGLKQGSTLDNSILLITIANGITGQQHQFYVGSGQQFYYEFMEDGLTLNTPYTYGFAYTIVSGSASTPLDLIIEAREV